MSVRKRLITTLKCCAGLLIVGSVAVAVVHLERQRPIMALERAGATLVAGKDGLVRSVTFASPLATDEHLDYLARLTTVRSVYLSRSRVTRSGLGKLRSLPDLRTLDLSETPYASGSLSTVCEVPSLRTLILRNCHWISDAEVRSLERLPELHTLVVAQTPLTDVGLARISAVRGLMHFNIDGCDAITDAGVSLLRKLPHLEQVALDHCDSLSEAGIMATLSFPALESVSARGICIRRQVIEELRLTHPRPYLAVDEIDASDLQPLLALGADVGLDNDFEVKLLQLDGRGRGRVRALDGARMRFRPTSQAMIPVAFSGVRLESQVLEILRRYPEISWLSLRDVPCTDAVLAEVGRLKSLRSLQIESHAITDAGLAALADLTHLERLELCGDSLSGEGLAALRDLPGLRVLELVSHNLTTAGLERTGELITLEWLTLGAPVPDAGWEAVGRLPKLRELALGRATITGAAGAALARSPSLRRLKVIESTLTREGLVSLTPLATLVTLQIIASNYPAPALDAWLLQRPDASVWISDRGWDVRTASPTRDAAKQPIAAPRP